MSDQTLPFEMPDRPDDAADHAPFLVDIDGFEGPLDLLLALARAQKVDLSRLSILALAEQYLAFVDDARSLRLELAADYLVMAAWLAYLKSRLLVPRPEALTDEGDPQDLADALALRLRRLLQIREASAALMRRTVLGRDIFARGAPEVAVLASVSPVEASLYDLLQAYTALRQVQARAVVRLEQRKVWSLADARAMLERLIGDFSDWAPLDAFLMEYCVSAEDRRTALASSFASSLEMAREGLIDIQQDKPFATVYIRKTSADKPTQPT